jgi:hypothetical protein
MTKPQSHSSSSTIQVMAALLALLLGFLLYILTRQQSQVFFLGLLPEYSIVTLVIDNVVLFALPSMLHTYAFILLTTAVLETGPVGTRLACLLWVMIELLFECAQHPELAPFLSAVLPPWFDQVTGLNLVRPFIMNGQFDYSDIIFILLGAFAAYATFTLSHKQENKPVSPPNHM